MPDASLVLVGCFDDEATPETDELLRRLERDDEAIVPSHWPAEVMNGLLLAVRRKRISKEKAHRFILDLPALPIRYDAGSALIHAREVLAFAQQFKLTAYDASISS